MVQTCLPLKCQRLISAIGFLQRKALRYNYTTNNDNNDQEVCFLVLKHNIIVFLNTRDLIINNN